MSNEDSPMFDMYARLATVPVGDTNRHPHPEPEFGSNAQALLRRARSVRHDARLDRHGSASTHRGGARMILDDNTAQCYTLELNDPSAEADSIYGAITITAHRMLVMDAVQYTPRSEGGDGQWYFKTGDSASAWEQGSSGLASTRCLQYICVELPERRYSSTNHDRYRLHRLICMHHLTALWQELRETYHKKASLIAAAAETSREIEQYGCTWDELPEDEQEWILQEAS